MSALGRASRFDASDQHGLRTIAVRRFVLASICPQELQLDRPIWVVPPGPPKLNPPVELLPCLEFFPSSTFADVCGLSTARANLTTQRENIVPTEETFAPPTQRLTAQREFAAHK